MLCQLSYSPKMANFPAVPVAAVYNPAPGGSTAGRIGVIGGSGGRKNPCYPLANPR